MAAKPSPWTMEFFASYTNSYKVPASVPAGGLTFIVLSFTYDHSAAGITCLGSSWCARYVNRALFWSSVAAGYDNLPKPPDDGSIHSSMLVPVMACPLFIAVGRAAHT